MTGQSDTPQVRSGRDSSLTPYFVLIPIALTVCTFLRVSLLVIYPFIILLLGYFFRFRITGSMILLLCLAGLSFCLSLLDNFFLTYKLLSLYYMIPFLFLLFASPGPDRYNEPDNLKIFIQCITGFVLLNDIIGLVQVIQNTASDDSFRGIYSEYSVSINGLMLLNTILFFYYLTSFRNTRSKLQLAASIFFLGCGILGYYGAGLMVCLVAFILSFFTFSLKQLIKTTLITVVALTLLYTTIYLVKPQTLDYNIANLKKFASLDVATGPRKLISFYNYAVSYPTNVKDLVFGSGPGTFNSRSAFMIGSPSYFSSIQFLKDPEQPYYFKNYAYTLWNEKNTVKELYLDGFRNQPFSSVLAFLGEYGLLFTLFFALLYYFYYKKVAGIYKSLKRYPEAEARFRFFKFLILLLPLLLLIDNYYEFPEIVLPIVLLIKFSHQRLLALKEKFVVNG